MGRAGSTVAPVLLFYTFSSFVCFTFHPTVLFTMDLQSNASKVVELTAKIKKLTDQLNAVKSDLIDQMLAENVQQVQIKRQNVSLCQRKNKDFGDTINRQELELKAEKRRLETLGEFTISSVTNFIQVR